MMMSKRFALISTIWHVYQEGLGRRDFQITVVRLCFVPYGDNSKFMFMPSV